MTTPARRQALSSLSRRLGFQSDWYLIGVGAVVGTLTGLGAAGFASLLHAFEGLTHRLQTGAGPAFIGPGPLWVVLGPLIGMGLTGVLVHAFASEAKGHGVPQVLLALIKKGGRIPARIGLTKVVASILTVGSGGSAGTEGPIVQIGATFGSSAGRVLGIDRQAMQTLVGCGAAAGISSIFNAPIAGVFFVLEILLRDFSVKIFTPIVVASVFSQVTTQALSAATGGAANEAVFATDELVHDLTFRFSELPSYVVLGGVCGLVAIAFNRVLHKGEDVFDRLRLGRGENARPVHAIAKPLIGAGLLGAMGLAFLALPGVSDTPGHDDGHANPVPAFYGNGYQTIRGLLDPDAYAAGPASPDPASPDPASPNTAAAESADAAAALTGDAAAVSAFADSAPLLALLLGFKLVATVLTLASGGSGGVFAPSLFLGAVAGAAFGIGLESAGLMPDGSTPASYALVGMAAVVAASTHAPLTAILMLYELTRNVYVVLPIMLSATIATVIAQTIERDSVYTFKLRRMGVLVGAARDVTILRRLSVRDVELAPLQAETVYASDPVSKLISLHATHNVPDFCVVDQSGRYLGMVTGAAMRAALIDREAIPLLLVAEIMRSDIETVAPDDTLDAVMDKLARFDTASLVVVEPPPAWANPDEPPAAKPTALITRSAAIRRYQQALDGA